MLLALAVHMLGARYGLDLGGLWQTQGQAEGGAFMPAGSAIAWWLIATVGFYSGYFIANIMHSAVSGEIPQRARNFLVVVGVLMPRASARRFRARARCHRPPACWRGSRRSPRRPDGVLRRQFRTAQELTPRTDTKN